MHPAIPTVVVVTGPPAGGKSAIADGLRERLGLPLVAKDTIKEALAGELGITERADSHRLGRAVFELMGTLVQELVDAGVSLIVEGNFLPSTRVFAGLDARFAQVHVTAAPEVLRERLSQRTGRHPVHYDNEAAEEIAARVAAGEWPPLDLPGTLVTVDTSERRPDLDELAARLR